MGSLGSPVRIAHIIQRMQVVQCACGILLEQYINAIVIRELIELLAERMAGRSRELFANEGPGRPHGVVGRCPTRTPSTPRAAVSVSKPPLRFPQKGLRTA